MPLKDRGKKLREFININHKLVNSHTLFYETVDGKIPAKEFLLSLDYDMRAKMIRTLEMLQKNGPALREPQSKELDDGIFELRAKFGSNISRLFYFYDEGRIVLLTNGFVKKTQKTPKKEIELAKTYRADYYARKEKL